MPRGLYVVGVKASAASWSTLSWAIAEAAALGADLVLCHACPPGSPLSAPGVATRLAALELADPALARAVVAARARLGADRVTVDVRTGPPERALAACAAAADLLVIGASPRPLTQSIVDASPCPVVLVPPNARERERLVRQVSGAPAAVPAGVRIGDSRAVRLEVR